MANRSKRTAARARSAVVLTVAVGAVVLAGCAAQAATRSAARPAPCGPSRLRLFGPRPPAPKRSFGALSTAVVADFGLLRRPQSPSDLPSAQGLGRVRPDRWLAGFFELATYDPAAIRRLDVRSGDTSYYVVPGFGRREAVPPARCQSAAARRELLAQQRRRSVEPVACIVESGGMGSAAVGCDPFAAIGEQLEIFASTSGAGPVVQLVPDGVASVRISYRAGAPILAPVAGDALVFTPPRGRRPRSRRAAAASAPLEVEWLDAAGAVMRTIGRPTPASVAATSVGDLRAPIGG